VAFDIEPVREDLGLMVRHLSREARDVFERLVLPGWTGPLHGYPATLYGLLMDVFAHVDLLSAYWRGNNGSGGQFARMSDFIVAYMWPDRDAARNAVRQWRHALMHTGRPRLIHSKATGVDYYWLLHWGEPHLPRDHHARFQVSPGRHVLNVGLLFLIEDLERAIAAYLADLKRDPILQANYAQVDPLIRVQRF
jgi:hypothetical protein